MVMQTMYPPQKDSPSTFLTGNITATDTLITVGNAAILPQTVPYPLTLGIDKNITETVMVTAIGSGNNQLTVTRGSGALAWTANTNCGRVFNAADLKTVQDNVKNVIDQSNADHLALDAVTGQVADNTEDISDLNITFTGLIGAVSDDLAAETSRATGVEATLGANKINRTELPQVITDWLYTADGTSLVVEITRYNASNQTTTTFNKTMPIVNDTDVGIMTPEAYTEITALRNDVNMLINQGGRFIGISFATKAALNSYVVPAAVKSGDYTYVIDDETHQYATTRYVYNGTAFDFSFVIDYDPVGFANSSTPGLVKGDAGTTNGKVFVETDGSMSVIGWDALNTRVTNVETAFAGTIITGSGTIPATGWVANTGDYPLKKDFAITGVTIASWVDIAINQEYQDIAQAAEICQTITEYAGGITLYAKTTPTADITVKWKILKPTS